MPYVNIKITNENVTKEQKSKLIEGATQFLVDVLNKNSATTVVVIDEVNTDNWGIGGECVRSVEKNNSTSFLSFGPSAALHPPAHIQICTGGCALQPNQNPAQSCGIIYFH